MALALVAHVQGVRRCRVRRLWVGGGVRVKAGFMEVPKSAPASGEPAATCTTNQANNTHTFDAQLLEQAGICDSAQPFQG